MGVSGVAQLVNPFRVNSPNKSHFIVCVCVCVCQTKVWYWPNHVVRSYPWHPTLFAFGFLLSSVLVSLWFAFHVPLLSFGFLLDRNTLHGHAPIKQEQMGLFTMYVPTVYLSFFGILQGHLPRIT